MLLRQEFSKRICLRNILLLIIMQLSKQQNNTKTEISISIQLVNRETRLIEEATFTYNLLQYKLPIENEVVSFCENHKLIKKSCRLLMEKALNELIEGSAEYPKYLNYLRYSDLRTRDTLVSEILNAFTVFISSKLQDDLETVNSELHIEESIDQTIYNYYKSQQDSNLLVESVCFIHSCSLYEDNADVLIEILELLKSSNLISRLRMIVVLNYGYPLPSSLQSQYPNILFIHRSVEINKFEIPTLRHLHHFTKSIHKDSLTTGNIMESTPIQVLYLHTKGVSYKDIYQPAIDWRKMMLYFIVEQHQSIYYLLLSGAFDIAGCNYVSNPRNFEGNMWWGNSNYLATLPEIFRDGYKNEAELWIFRSPYVRVYIPHISTVDHYNEVYPRHMYANRSSNSVPRKKSAGVLGLVLTDN